MTDQPYNFLSSFVNFGEDPYRVAKFCCSETVNIAKCRGKRPKPRFVAKNGESRDHETTATNKRPWVCPAVNQSRTSLRQRGCCDGCFRGCQQANVLFLIVLSLLIIGEFKVKTKHLMITRHRVMGNEFTPWLNSKSCTKHQ